MKKQITLNRFGFPVVACLSFLGTNASYAQPDNRFQQPHSRNQFEVLVYTSPDKWHNITEPVALLAFQDLAQKHAFGFTWTTVNSMFNDKNLVQFDVIVFLQSTSRDFSSEELESFKRFIRKGGG